MSFIDRWKKAHGFDYNAPVGQYPTKWENAIVEDRIRMASNPDPGTVNVLPTDPIERKATPITSGVLDYFPSAIAEVAKVSKAGNDKHNPGEPMHHARGKSTDHADSIARHLVERGGVDPDTGVRHSAELAWRALALLQQELEDAGAPLARGARLPVEGNSRDRREWQHPLDEYRAEPPHMWDGV